MSYHEHTRRRRALAFVAAVVVIVAACVYGFYTCNKTRDQECIDIAQQRMGAFSEFNGVTVRTNAWGNDVPGIQMTDEARMLLGRLAVAYNADPSTSLKIDPSEPERAYHDDAVETFNDDPSRNAALALWLWMARSADLVYAEDDPVTGVHAGDDANPGRLTNLQFIHLRVSGSSVVSNVRFRWEGR